MHRLQLKLNFLHTIHFFLHARVLSGVIRSLERERVPAGCLCAFFQPQQSQFVRIIAQQGLQFFALFGKRAQKIAREDGNAAVQPFPGRCHDPRDAQGIGVRIVKQDVFGIRPDERAGQRHLPGNRSALGKAE